MACSKLVTLSKKIHIFLVLFLLQDNSYSCLFLKFQVSKLKINNLAAKVLIFKTFITSKLIDLNKRKRKIKRIFLYDQLSSL
jgi:hypothetical protein